MHFRSCLTLQLTNKAKSYKQIQFQTVLHLNVLHESFVKGAAKRQFQLKVCAREAIMMCQNSFCFIQHFPSLQFCSDHGQKRDKFQV